MSEKPVNLKKALQEPAAMFSTPEQVASHPDLTSEQKIEILRMWEYDAAEMQVATEEGMPDRGNGDDLLRRILLALDGLIGGMGVGDSGPTKQHAVLPRRCR